MRSCLLPKLAGCVVGQPKPMCLQDDIGFSFTADQAHGGPVNVANGVLSPASLGAWLASMPGEREESLDLPLIARYPTHVKTRCCMTHDTIGHAAYTLAIPRS
jgi:hypothetical protein